MLEQKGNESRKGRGGRTAKGVILGCWSNYRSSKSKKSVPGLRYIYREIVLLSALALLTVFTTVFRLAPKTST